MAMNLSAIQPRKTAAEGQIEQRIVQGNRAATNGNLLFRNTAPVLEAIAKSLKAEAALQPVSPTDDLAAAIKAVTADVEKATSALQPAAAPTPAVSAQAQRSIGNPPSVPMRTETQHRRETDAREEARKAAARDEADRVLVQKSGPRVMTFRKLDANLSDAALAALSHIVTAWEKNDRRPIRMYAADLHRALDIPLATAQAAFTELVDKRLIISFKNSVGALLVQPGLGVTGA